MQRIIYATLVIFSSIILAQEFGGTAPPERYRVYGDFPSYEKYIGPEQETIEISGYDDIIRTMQHDFISNEEFPWEIINTAPLGIDGNFSDSCDSCVGAIPEGPSGSLYPGEITPMYNIEPIESMYNIESMTGCKLPADFEIIVKNYYNDIILLLAQSEEEIEKFHEYMPKKCAKELLVYLVGVKERLAEA